MNIKEKQDRLILHLILVLKLSFNAMCCRCDFKKNQSVCILAIISTNLK